MAKKQQAKKRQRCFVIMPFSKTTEQHTKTYWTNHFERFLKPLIEENPDLEAHRSKPMRGDMLMEIIRYLVVSPVVVADLTDHNPNVYWELGVRQSFKHGTVTIAEAETPLPFDIGGKGTLFYHSKDHLEMENFRKDFKEAIQDCLTNPNRPDSHVLETISGRGTLFEIFRRDEAMRRLDALLEECRENLELLEDCVKCAHDNQEKEPKKRQWPTMRFRSASIELLATERYVDEPDSFFGKVSKWMNWVPALNYELNRWSYKNEAVEHWILKSNEMATKVISSLQDEVIAIRDKLTEIL